LNLDIESDDDDSDSRSEFLESSDEYSHTQKSGESIKEFADTGLYETKDHKVSSKRRETIMKGI